jgi:hypothetical protein
MNDTSLAPTSFAVDIRPMFRESDRLAMLRAFDLWSYPDVRDHAPQIAERLQDGTMPCDGPWTAEDVTKFANWVRGGAKP